MDQGSFPWRIGCEQWSAIFMEKFEGRVLHQTTNSRNSPKEYVGHLLLVGETVPDSGKIIH